MECSKCWKELAFYSSDAICCCENCKKYFCENEGHILNKSLLIEVAKRTNYRIIYEFLCFGCEAKQKTKGVEEEARKKENEKLAKKWEERDRAEMLKAQMLHNSDNWETEFDETEKLPELGDFINNWERKPRKIIRPCSRYVELYGNKWPTINTEIYLIFTHYKMSEGRLLFEKTEHYCLLCAKRFLIGGLRNLERSSLSRQRGKTFKEKFPDIELNKE